ncbi:ATP-binding protein [Streptomonospora salina]|uniref:ATP-binding protein n=2 Tax=Streptomonospora salina TaxID=104205 RepID=UPI0031E51C23
MQYCPSPPPETMRGRRHRRPVFSAAPAEVPAARAWIDRTLRSTGRRDDIGLVADELLSNALTHAPPAPGDGYDAAVLVVEETPSGQRVVVWSRSSAATVPAARRTDSLEEYGRGLALVAALAEDWGWFTADGWTAVWARFEVGGDRS